MANQLSGIKYGVVVTDTTIPKSKIDAREFEAYLIRDIVSAEGIFVPIDRYQAQSLVYTDRIDRCCQIDGIDRVIITTLRQYSDTVQLHYRCCNSVGITTDFKVMDRQLFIGKKRVSRADIMESFSKEVIGRLYAQVARNSI